MQNQLSNMFETEQLVALYMVNAQVGEVSYSELCKFNDYISKKINEHELNLLQNKRLNCMFLLSDFHIRQLVVKSPKTFKVSQKDEKGERIISCVDSKLTDEAFKNLQQMLSVGALQNAKFMDLANSFAKEYVKEKQIVEPKTKHKKLTPEQEDQRWWNYFGK